MIRRVFLALVLAWLLGLVWFAIALPGPAGKDPTDAIVVLTGGSGRIARGVDVLEKGWSRAMLVSGVDRQVRPEEFAAANAVPARLMRCCIRLGKEATNTVSNADEAADWVRARGFKSIRLITSDWHMRRARLELDGALHGDARIVSDGVKTAPGLNVIVLEYHKYLLRRASTLFGN